MNNEHDSPHDDISYKHSRKDVIIQIQGELEKAEKSYRSIIAVSDPGKQSSLDIYFSGKKAAYGLVLELLAEVPDNEDDTTGDNSDNADHQPLRCSPVSSKQTGPEAQEVN
ncbi:hypothetical protein [Methanolobus profundi]|uniref:hypothetical protein n=1 Tax=Methanolobus profundi TaxID=487685 RepID=UPI000B82C12D|nr:hypothetical protein [Methanolobus profundi]